MFGFVFDVLNQKMDNMKSIKILIALLMAGSLSLSAQDKESMYFTASVEGTIETVEPTLRSELEKEKFGVITEIDMAKTLKEKIDADIMPYKILGVCNAKFAYKAMQAEENIGVFLPCKVILKQVDKNTVEVVAVNPVSMMKMIGNKDLDGTADEVGIKLEMVIKRLADR